MRRNLFILAAALALAGCRQDMHDAPRYDPLEETAFFANNSSARMPVANTVARGQVREDDHLYLGRVNGQLAVELPMPLTPALMARGQERFNVFCSPCHGQTGIGNGMIVQRGFRQPPSYFEDRLVEAPIGYFYDVMTNGFGAMQDYASQVPVEDRWAIAAYIRALQLSHRATLDDVPADQRAALEAAPVTGAAPAPGPVTPGPDFVTPDPTAPGPDAVTPAPGAPPPQENQ